MPQRRSLPPAIAQKLNIPHNAPSASAQRTPSRVAVLCAPGIPLFMKAMPELIFLVANDLGLPYEVNFVNAHWEGGEGVTIANHAPTSPSVINAPLPPGSAHTIGLSPAEEAALTAADIVVIPYWPHFDARPSDALLQRLRTHHAEHRPLVALCYGAFALAHAGLLDGRPAVTHWASVEAFAERFPAVKLHADALYCESDGILTSAGVTAGIDCCLYLMRQLHGAQVANDIARLIVSPPFREGGQLQFLSQPLPVRTRDTRLNRAMQYAETHLERALSVEQLAEVAAMSERTFYRAFQKAVGLSPAQWIRQRRLTKATELLERSSASIEEIAFAVGFDSSVTFRQAFHQHYGVAPTRWRHTFAGGDLSSDSRQI